MSEQSRVLTGRGSGQTIQVGYRAVMSKGHPRANRDGYVLEHILIAERALGRFLPEAAVVHHVDENRTNNVNANLVICQDRSYHNLLHARARALAACGHADWQRCEYCKQYDDTARLSNFRRDSRNQSQNYHRACAAAYQRKRTGRAAA